MIKCWFLSLSTGAIVDKTDSYTISFLVAGLLMSISGFMCFPLRRISNWEKARDARARGEYQDVPPVPDISMEDLHVEA